jgi:hypothetical protein
MLALAKSLPHRPLVPAAATLFNSTRNKTVWIYRLAPEPPISNKTVGPWPRTKEEREKAARKYNLIPEDYQPFPEEDGWGDYPDLPAVGAYNRYKYDDFDDPQDMRFYGEPFHISADMYYWERIDPMESEKIAFKQFPWWKRAVVCFGFPALIYGIYYGLEKSRVNINHPWKIREYSGGQPLYAFPPSSSDHDHHHH